MLFTLCVAKKEVFLSIQKMSDFLILGLENLIF